MDVEFDTRAGIAYVADSGLSAVVAVNLATGVWWHNRTDACGASGLRTRPRPQSPLRIRHRRRDLTGIDLPTGNRSIVSGGGIGAGTMFGALGDIALDGTNGRLLAIDEYPARVLAVDIATGNRTVISGPANSQTAVGGGPALMTPRGIDIDAQRQIEFVTDDAYDALFAVDLLSGFRQIVVK